MTICYPTTTEWGCALTEAQIDELDPVIKARSEALAWTTLQRLTGGLIAICPTIIRPCAARCSGGTWYTSPVTGLSQSPWFQGNGWMNPQPTATGEWINACGCSSPDVCSCTSISEVILPGMVGSIVKVSVAGVILPATAYRVDDGNRLVRQDGDVWPACQDMSVPPTDPTAFVVEYYDGAAPDSSLNFAAGLLAVEYYRACTGQTCQLPNGVTNIVKQGVTIQVATGLFTNGYTGIQAVDSVIAIYNPHGHKARPQVLSPDIRSGRRQTWGRY